jgi:magnesium transporter
MCSITLAAVNFIKLLLVDHMLLSSFDGKWLIEISVVCLTLAFTVIVSKLFGSALPIVAKKIGFDPAVMASPFITTIVDALSLVIYLNIATYVLGI